MSEIKTNIIIFITVCLIIVASLFFVFRAGDPPKADNDTQELKAAVIEPQSLPDPCQLKDVVCNNEPKTIYAKVTGYSEIDSCHYENCVMASGKRAYIGAVACPRDVRLGTWVLINNTPYTCEDRTSLSLNGRYDIFFGYGKPAHTAAIAFGKRNLAVQILQ